MKIRRLEIYLCKDMQYVRCEIDQLRWHILAELCPTTCPLCVIVKFNLSGHRRGRLQIQCQLGEGDSGGHSLLVVFYVDDEFGHLYNLSILADKDKSRHPD